MYELHKKIIALLIADAYLQAQCIDAGATGVDVVPEGDRMLATYPRIVLTCDDGAQHETADRIAKLFDGRVRIEIVCRLGDACPAPLKTMRALQGQIQDILLGNRTKGLPGICGQKLGEQYNCTRFKQVSPTGKLPSDANFERFRITFDVTVNRKDW